MGSKKLSVFLIISNVIFLVAVGVLSCLYYDATNDQPVTEEKATSKNPFDVWKENYLEPVEVDYSQYPDFMRGVWAPRIDVARVYLERAEDLRSAGVDTIMLEVEVYMEPETKQAVSITDDLFKFYIQAFKKQGFRVVILPNPGHPSFSGGLGFAWGGEGDGTEEYVPGKELLDELSVVTLKWAEIAQEYGCYGFLPLLEPHVFASSNEEASDWLQEMLPLIKEVYSGKVGATDIMYNSENSIIPYPFDYSGYDFIVGGPPAGRKPEILNEWIEDVDEYIDKGIEYSETYDAEGFILYEWGSYVSGVWYEDVQMCIYDQCLNANEALQVVNTGIELQEEKDGIIGSFPILGTGWIEWDTKGFESIAHWYNRMEHYTVEPVEDEDWNSDEILLYERILAGDEYENLCTLDSWSICYDMGENMSE